MLDRSALREFRPLIMTPSHDGTFFFTYLASIIQLMAAGPGVGLPINFMFQCGDSLVTRARNHLVALFLSQPEWTHLMWIDADIGFSPESFFRLLLSNHDIAAGIYPLKREDWPAEGVPAGTTEADFRQLYTRYTVNAGQASDPHVGLDVDADGFMTVREAPTGFMLIKRHVFYKMIEAYPDLRYTPDMIGSIDPSLYYRLFDVSMDPESNRYLSEDYTFCRRWEQMGGKIHVDANSNLAHMGGKIYRGDFAGSLKRDVRYAVTAPVGMRYVINGLENLMPNPPGPV
ncbi:MAG: hypothetical protein WCI94_21920 [Rhodospirillales bacterium]